MILRVIGPKFGENNVAIIGFLQAQQRSYWEVKWLNVLKYIKYLINDEYESKSQEELRSVYDNINLIYTNISAATVYNRGLTH